MTIPVSLFCSVHIAFYLWYGNPEHDGKWMHWNHKVLPHWNKEIDAKYPKFDYNPPDQHHAPYRPLRGLYSSKDPKVMSEQLTELAEAGVDTIMFSWWGIAEKNVKRDDAFSGANTDLLLKNAINIGSKVGLGVSFHIEPYGGRSAESFYEDGKYILETYFENPNVDGTKLTGSVRRRIDALQNQPIVFWVYDVSARHTKKNEEAGWKSTLDRLRELYQTRLNRQVVFFCLWLDNEDGSKFVQPVGFDGGYSYFAAERFTPASTSSNWKRFSKDLFIPAVGPGYDDSLIRPWNISNKRTRGERGEYYDNMWSAAMDFNIVTITSYNEWGEGTQVEGAVPYTSSTGEPKYLQYSEPNFYMKKTKDNVSKYKSRCKARNLQEQSEL